MGAFIIVTQSDGEKKIIAKRLIEDVDDDKNAEAVSGISGDKVNAVISYVKDGKRQTVYTRETIDKIFDQLNKDYNGT